MDRFFDELTRFMEKYRVQPDPADAEATDTYWFEVNDATLAWSHRYEKDKRYDTIYCPFIHTAFRALEALWLEKGEPDDRYA